MTTTNPTTAGWLRRTYDVHGVALDVRANDAEMLAAVHGRLGYFAAPLPEGAPAARFTFVMGEAAADLEVMTLPSGRRPVYQSVAGEVSYAAGPDLLLMTTGAGAGARCDLRAGSAVLWSLRTGSEAAWQLSHPLLTLAFIELMKRRARYSLHAGALGLGGRTLLLPGTSGAGKSTLTVALLLAGFSYQSDDMVLLDCADDAVVRVLALPDDIDLTAGTLSFFPALSHLQGQAPPLGWPKHAVPAGALSDLPVVRAAEPAALVFPRVAGQPHSRLVPLPSDEALLELTPNVLLTNPTASQHHLDALGRLARTCPSYRLDTGTDFGEVVGLLRGLLGQALPAGVVG